MRTSWRAGLLAAGLSAAAPLMLAGISGQTPIPWTGVLDEHPSIQYASRPSTDRVAMLNRALQQGARILRRDARTGYLLPVLDALGISRDSQILVFSKTGVQRAYTSPHNP